MQYANNAATTLASGITNSATSLTVASGTGTLFPTLTGSQYFYCTLQGASGTPTEIIKVTAVATDTFTIVRAQDGTTASAFSTGDKVELRLVRANLNTYPVISEANTFSATQTFGKNIVETSTAMGSTAIDLSTGNYFSYTVSTTTTFTITNNASSGSVNTLVLDLTNGGSSTVTWWTGVKWAGGTAPTLSASGRDVLAFFSRDGGTTWNGFLLGKGMA